MRRIAVLDAPSNLGLRPPTPTSVPGCAKAPGALRDHGLLRRLNARDAGCLTPPRYDPGDWRPGDGVCHAPEISAYSRKLADRIGAILDQGEFPVVLGGDCSIVLGSALAMHRLGEAVGGRIGLVFVDGHSDFRHPGNASYVGAAAGEDLALVTGRGQTDLAAMEGRRPYYRDIDVVVMGIRAQDEYRLDLQAAGIVTRPVPTLRVEGAARSAQWARDQLVDCAGYWVHIDVDVLDPAVMPAVDAPEPGGIAFPELEILLAGLVESPHCLGVEITVFDPDYDPDGRYAEEITSTIVAGLQPAQLVDARPDLVAARRDLAGPGRLGPGRLGPGRLGPRGVPTDAPAARTALERDTMEARRAMAAEDERVAAARSSGGSPGEPAVPVPAPELDAAAFPTAFPAASMASPAVSSTVFPAASPAASSTVFPAASSAASPTAPSAAFADTSSAADEREDRESGQPVADDLVAGTDGDDWIAAEVSEPENEPLDDAVSEPHGAAVAEPLGSTISEPHGAAVAEPLGSIISEPLDDAVPEPVGAAVADPAVADPAVDVAAVDVTEVDVAAVDVVAVDVVDAELVEAEVVDLPEPEPVTGADDAGSMSEERPEPGDEPAPMRPLGSAPLLDSKPLPATMPGMLRPRTIEDFSLPAQRPAFEVGPEQPADLG